MDAAGDAVGESRWPELERALLAGITHSLSNRAASVAAITSLAEPGQPWTPRLAGMLGSEATSLESIVRGLRLLTTDPTLPPEPIDLAAVVPALVALHDQHVDLRDVPCAVERVGDVARVTEQPLEFVRRVLTQIDDARREALASGRSLVVRYGGEPVVAIEIV